MINFNIIRSIESSLFNIIIMTISQNNCFNQYFIVFLLRKCDVHNAYSNTLTRF